ncbi:MULTISPECIES: Mu transposase C-terminal domain-containing protein [unclassified Pseudoxanthomonas]|uniref:Mu transposase C-terminal domain-containing protein n=1 Tax=unclassified Pseudoxanthomonas TaxID=2645906 RepID=UPI0008F0542D|nr:MULTISPECIES: Mu transposase C-terminal domain-containing protein [unclassified Pseudoxanthomonas]PPJ41274.1 hypothetical protein C0063_15585 [Pseudoxanthomonas sp. KAs_5_3]SFV30762.1 Mu transposase, C-terminal [Pseudoxanthomonas sp. YR558]
MYAELMDLARSLGLPASGLAYIEEAIAQPSRLTAAGPVPNRSTRFASLKMRVVIQAESATVELAFVRRCELDMSIIAILDQPPKIFYQDFDSIGRKRTFSYTPDYLIFFRTSILAIECKNRSGLLKLLEKNPTCYELSENGIQHPLRERAFAAMGIGFQIFDASSLTFVEKANNAFFVNHLRGGATALPSHIAIVARKLLARKPLTITQLQSRLGLPTVDQIVASVVSRDLFICERTHLATSPDTTCIFSDEAQCRMLEQALEQRLIEQEYSEYAVVVDSLTERQSSVLHSNIKAILDHVNAGALLTRQQYRYYARWNAARASGSSTIDALTPDYRSRGCEPYLDPRAEEAADQFLQNVYLTPSAPTLLATWRLLDQYLKDAGMSMSYETLRKRQHSLESRRVLSRRIGMRAALAGAPPVSAFDRELSPTVGWQRAHVDSTEIPVKGFLDWLGSLSTGKLKLYALVDDAHSYTYAEWMCFHGGTDALSLLLRECARRHGRVPHCIVGDQGSENISVYWQSVTAFFSIDLEERPAGASRYGGKGESFFGRIKKLFFRNMPGNTKNDRKGRHSDSKHRGRAHAIHTIRALVGLSKRFTSFLNRRPLSKELLSPESLMALDDERFSCLGIKVDASSMEFLARTAILDGTRMYSYLKGITYCGEQYFSDELRDRSLDGKVVNISYEPYDPTTIYVEANNRWYTLHSSAHVVVRALGRDERTARVHFMRNSGEARARAKREFDRETADLTMDGMRSAAAFKALDPPEPSTADYFAEARNLLVGPPNE